MEPRQRSIGQFLREEVATPLGLDIHLGMEAELQGRTKIADMVCLGPEEVTTGTELFSNFTDEHIHQVEEAAVVAGRADTLQQLARFLSHDKETEGRRLDQRSQWTCMPDTETGPGCRAKWVAEQCNYWSNIVNYGQVLEQCPLQKGGAAQCWRAGQFPGAGQGGGAAGGGGGRPPGGGHSGLYAGPAQPWHHLRHEDILHSGCCSLFSWCLTASNFSVHRAE